MAETKSSLQACLQAEGSSSRLQEFMLSDRIYGLPRCLRPPGVSVSSEHYSIVDGFSFDVWSFGMLALHTWTNGWYESRLGKRQYWTDRVYPLTILADSLEKPLFEILIKRAFPSADLSDVTISQVLNLIKGTLRFDEKKRPSVAFIRQHVLMSENDNEGDLLKEDIMWIYQPDPHEGKHIMDDLPDSNAESKIDADVKKLLDETLDIVELVTTMADQVQIEIVRRDREEIVQENRDNQLFSGSKKENSSELSLCNRPGFLKPSYLGASKSLEGFRKSDKPIIGSRRNKSDLPTVINSEYSSKGNDLRLAEMPYKTCDGSSIHVAALKTIVMQSENNSKECEPRSEQNETNHNYPCNTYILKDTSEISEDADLFQKSPESLASVQSRNSVSVLQEKDDNETPKCHENPNLRSRIRGWFQKRWKRFRTRYNCFKSSTRNDE